MFVYMLKSKLHILKTYLASITVLAHDLKVAHSASHLINLYNPIFKMPFQRIFTYILSPRKSEFYLSVYMSFLYLS